MDERVLHINGVLREVQMNSILPLRLLYNWHMIEKSLPDRCASDGIFFDRTKCAEWLNRVFQRHINSLESHLHSQFFFWSTSEATFFPARPVEDRLRERIDSRGSSESSGSSQLGSKSIQKNVREASTPQSSVVSSVVIVEKGNENKSSAEGAEGRSKARYLARVKNLDLEELACRRELMEILELKSLSHEDQSSHYCVD